MNCTFCDIVNKKKKDYIIWEDRKYMLILNNTPAKPGHCMLLPKKHVEGFFCLGTLQYISILLKAKKIAKILRKATKAKRIGLVVAGMSISHLHVQLVPINKKNELFAMMDRKEMTSDKLEKMCKDLKQFF